VPHHDAVLNSSHAALLTVAHSTRPELLLAATEDFLHQRYREPAYPNSMALIEELRSNKLAAVISGAGPAVLVLHTLAPGQVLELLSAAPIGFLAQELAISRSGVE
jgi:homoserine kinase